MKLQEYVNTFGEYTFKDLPFNMIDAAIFSYLSYVRFDDIIGNNKISIERAGNIHFKKYQNKIKKVTNAVKEGTILLYDIMKTDRYKNCKLMKYEMDENTQFCAISIEFMKKKVFVSFEGSDGSIAGWIENFNISHSFPTISHKEAMNYLDQYALSNVELYLGGHSKGGNLAQVSGAFSKTLIKHKIKKVYSFDGPGLLDTQFNSIDYTKDVSKYIHVVPNSSIVGMLLNNSNEIVVKSKNKPPYSHSVFTWEITNNGEFKEAKISSYSKEFRKSIFKFLEKYDKDERKNFIDNLNIILKNSNVETIIDLKENYKKVLKVLKESKDISTENKKFILDFLNVFIKAFQSAAADRAKGIVRNIKDLSEVKNSV